MRYGIHSRTRLQAVTFGVKRYVVLGAIGTGLAVGVAASAALSWAGKVLDRIDIGGIAPASMVASAADAVSRYTMRARTDFVEVSHQRANLCAIPAERSLQQKLATDYRLQAALVERISRKFRIDQNAATEVVRSAIRISQKENADPFLILGIIEIESSFRKEAKSGYPALGLMQIHLPSHRKLLSEMGVDTRNPEKAKRVLLSDVVANVTAGTRIFKTYERQLGSTRKALQAYNGARKDPTMKYARKVLASRDAYMAEVSLLAQINQSASAHQELARVLFSQDLQRLAI